MKKNSHRFLFRFPRIVSILFTLFISIFALDVFDMGLGFRGTIGALFIHLIPTRFMIAAIILSRKKYPFIGAIVFWFFGLRYCGTNFVQFILRTGEIAPLYLISQSFIIGLPAVITWFFFFRYRRLRKQGKIF